MLDAMRDFSSQPLGAIPLDNLVFIALIAIAVFLRWISLQAGKAKKKSEQQESWRPITPPTPAREESDEERIRRFLEALGQPTSSKPPPKITARPIQKRKVVPLGRPILSPLPPLTTVPPDLPPASRLPVEASSNHWTEPRVVEVREPVASPPTAAPQRIAPAVSNVTLFPETTAIQNIYPELSVLLQSQRGLRDAIILREVFGPPRSLQALDQLRSF